MTTADGLLVASFVTIVVVLAISAVAFITAGKREQEWRAKEDSALRDAKKLAADADREYRAAQRQSAEIYSQMEATVGIMSNRLDDLETQREQDHQTIIALSSRLARVEYIAGALRQQLVDAKIEPLWTLDDDGPADILAAVQVNTAVLSTKIGRLFNIEEMNNLALELGFDPEDIDGDTRTSRAARLVGYATRRGMIGQLIAKCEEFRPNNHTRWG